MVGWARPKTSPTAFSTAFAGREDELRDLIGRVDEFTRHLEGQTDDIIAANESVNALTGQFAQQKPVLDNALRTIPDALAVLRDTREDLVEAFDRLGKFSAVSAESANQTKEAFVKELEDLGPVLESLANSGPALTRSASLLATFPWPKENITKFFRGDYTNLSVAFDFTLSRLDTSNFTGTRWEGDLTKLELQWGRTIGQLPSPATGGNPLVVPYRLDQGP